MLSINEAYAVELQPAEVVLRNLETDNDEMIELASKIKWNNPRVYCVAVILLGLLVVIASNGMTMRSGRPHEELRALGLIFTGLGLFAILVANFAERTVRTPRDKVIIAKRVVTWEERICRLLGATFSLLSMLWFFQCIASLLQLYSRFGSYLMLWSGTAFVVCAGMATLSFLVGSLFSRR